MFRMFSLFLSVGLLAPCLWAQGPPLEGVFQERRERQEILLDRLAGLQERTEGIEGLRDQIGELRAWIAEDLQAGGGVERLREWLAQTLEKASRHNDGPRPLGTTLHLEFSVSGRDKTFRVTTATSEFRLHSNSETRVEESEAVQCQMDQFEMEGFILPDEEHLESLGYLIVCRGYIRISEEAGENPSRQSEVIDVNLHASAYCRPGESVEIVRHGETAVRLSVQAVQSE